MPKGETWSAYLFEKVHNAVLAHQVWEFWNVLWINCHWDSGAAAYHFDYDMDRCAWSRIPDTQDAPNGLMKNKGSLDAERDGNWTKIVATKTFRFENRPPKTAEELGSLLSIGLDAGWRQALAQILCP